jgi:hypothetical protein
MQVSTANLRAGGIARFDFSPNDALYFWLAAKTSLRTLLIDFSRLVGICFRSFEDEPDGTETARILAAGIFQESVRSPSHAWEQQQKQRTAAVNMR